MTTQYVGTMGTYMVTLADRLARTGVMPDLPFDPYMEFAEAESIIGTNVDFDWESLIGGEGVANVPLLGDLLIDPRTRAGRQQDFYEMRDELGEIIATLNSLTDRDHRKGFEYRQKHMALLKHRQQIAFMEQGMRQWRERREHLAKIPRELLSDDEKRERNRALNESRARILAGVNELMASIRGE